MLIMVLIQTWYHLIPHQLLNESFTALCVKYLIISHSDMQPKDYGCFMLENTYTRLYGGKSVRARFQSYIQTKSEVWVGHGVFMLSEARGEEH